MPSDDVDAEADPVPVPEPEANGSGDDQWGYTPMSEWGLDES